MLLYEVTLQVELAMAPAVEDHMRREHIPQIYASGCFERIGFDRASPTRFRTRYEARTEADLERYLRDYAPRLRAAFQYQFPAGVTLSRETWTSVESWG